MKISVRRLGPGDEAVLSVLANEDGDFDVEGRERTHRALSAEAARDFLADSSVLFWVAQSGEAVIGFLFCYDLKMRRGVGREVLLYEIGVRKDHRRKGVGRRLQGSRAAWMKENEVSEAWVLADNPDAIEFYRKCGFKEAAELAVYMTKERRETSSAAAPSRKRD